MNRFLLAALIIAVLACSTDANATSAYKRRDPQPAVTQATPMPAPDGMSEDQVMQSNMQSVMSSLSQDQLSSFAACIEKYVDPQTANNVAMQSMGAGGVPGAAPVAGSYQNTQQFLSTPQGQQVMQNCQAEIQALIPTVQNQAQKDLAGKAQINSQIKP